MVAAGRIADSDIALLRERSPIADIVGARVTLRSAGSGSLKGLCPFHSESTPSFNVSPTRGVFHCFGCGVGGDVISFVMTTELLSFTEAVEWLAAKAGIQLHYTDVDGRAASQGQRKPGQRQRLIAAHTAAAAFYAEQLLDPGAAGSGAARRFLTERGFDEAAAQRFGCGFAPDGWDELAKQLLRAGFSQQELIIGGLCKTARSGSLIDRFRRRLVWPIADLTGEVIGFGARRLFDDDSGPKYLNTPETPIYKKSHVLYGVDVAKRDIAGQYRAVVVEGYTDVMACHLAGVRTAVATCGTAFGFDHISVLRRLLMDQDEFRGEVIFTFDGDAAGQKAALKAFSDEQRFVAQTFIAVSPDGMDPCELRVAQGDAAVADLVARREPLIAFALRSAARRYDLETAEGRVAALRATAPLVARIKDRALKPEYVRSLAGTLGMETEPVARAVAQAGRSQSPGPHLSGPPPAPRVAAGGSAATVRPDPEDPALRVERESLRLAVQLPALAGPHFDALDADLFTHAVYADIKRAMTAVGGAASGLGAAQWIASVQERCDDPIAKATLRELAVEGLRSPAEPDPMYVGVVLARLQELALTRSIVEHKSRLQRVNPVEHAQQYERLFGELIALEQRKRGLREQAIGSLG
ncbi:MAG: DNA primase [Mycobacteriales bacterium]